MNSNAKTTKRLLKMVELKTETDMTDKDIAKELNISLRQYYRYHKKMYDMIFSDEYKRQATNKFLQIWLSRLKQAELDYSNNIKKYDKDTGEEVIDSQARVQFSKVYNDTIKEAERFFSKIGLLDAEKQQIDVNHSGNIVNEMKVLEKYLKDDESESE